MAESGQESKQKLSNDFEGRINTANGRLRIANCRVRIQHIKRKLYLQATLPPKPDSGKAKPCQQRIALGLSANPAGLSLAEKKAREIDGLLGTGQFSWEPYLKQAIATPQTIADWLERFEAEFRSEVEAITWRTDYANVFRRLPASEPLTEAILKTAVLATKPNSKTRRRFALALGKLARFAGLEGNFKAMQGTYSASQVEPRDLPDDRLIAECYRSIESPGWRWIFGMIATFGLRGHEPFYLDTEDLQRGGYMIKY